MVAVIQPRSLAVALAAALVLPASIRAQAAPSVRREIAGFDCSKDGVWRRQARRVRAQRARLLAGRSFGALNAAVAAAGGGPLSAGAPLAGAAAVSGVLRVPAVLFKFKNTPNTELRNTTQYNQVLFAASPTGASAGRPYTYSSWYAQLSNGLLSIQGASYGYAALDSNEVSYTGTAGTCSGSPFKSTDCNGLFSNNAFTRMQSGLRLALAKIDTQVDWTQYDNDGDGYVDLVAFIQPALDGACGPAGNNHLWSHRYYLADLFGNVVPYTTHSVNSSGVHIKVADYILESGVGGESACDSTQIMPIGTVAHETGHGLGLPDLYDVNYLTPGIGRYSLMGYGPYFSGFSPARLDAWSLSQLGWVTVVPLASAGTYSSGPGPTSDTAFYVPVSGSNPRGEYFLLENREGVQSDSVMIARNCQVWYQPSPPPATCGGGLLVYHIDSTQIAQHGLELDNTVNSGPIHGVEVVQADGFGNLDASLTGCAGPTSGCYDYGDAGDVYPGAKGKATLAISTLPSNVLNTGACSGFRVDTISQVPNGEIRFALIVGGDSVSVTTVPQLPGGRWGYTYSRGLNAACGAGSYTWVVDSAAPPPGLALSSAGLLSGAPTDTGAYVFRVSVTDGAATSRRTMTLRVAEPSLTLQQVLNLAFAGPFPAGDDLRRYLDLQGNGNGMLDIGDVLRWLQRTGNLGAVARLQLAGRRP